MFFLMVVVYFLLMFQSIGTLVSITTIPFYNKPWKLDNCSLIIYQEEEPTEEKAAQDAKENQSEGR